MRDDYRKNLKSVTTMPVVLPSGRVCITPGYVSEIETYCDFDADDFELPETPTRSQLVAALRQVWRPWSEFRFATNHDRAGMLAAIFGAVCRPAMDIAPAVVFDAPMPGSGKSLAASCVGALVTGRPVSAIVGARVGDDDEMRKLVVAELIAGREILLLDNLHGSIAGSVLEGLITAGRVTGRVLGQSQAFEGDARMVVMMSSNNATLSSDMARRCVVVRIDTGEEVPQMIEHGFNPVTRTLTERLAILRGVFALVTGFHNAGSPTIAKGDAGFPEWNRMVRQLVLWLQREGITTEAGIDDVGDPAWSLTNSASRSSPDTDGLSLILQGLRQHYKDEFFLARDVARWLESGWPGGGSDDRLSVLEGLELLQPGRGGKFTAAGVGMLLGYRVDRPCQGLVLRKLEAGKGLKGYKVLET